MPRRRRGGDTYRHIAAPRGSCAGSPPLREFKTTRSGRDHQSLRRRTGFARRASFVRRGRAARDAPSEPRARRRQRAAGVTLGGDRAATVLARRDASAFLRKPLRASARIG